MRDGTLLDVREYFVNTLKIYFVRRIYSKISPGNGEKMNPIGHESVNTISVCVLRRGSFTTPGRFWGRRPELFQNPYNV